MSALDYTITNPRDPLYDGTLDHPKINEYFEWTIRNMDDESKALHRRLRREQWELKQRHAREIREHIERQRAELTTDHPEFMRGRLLMEKGSD